MLMQAGFCLLETGFARAKNGINVAIKNLVDFLISSLVYWALRLRADVRRVVVRTLRHVAVRAGRRMRHGACSSTLFFQLMFCSTATTIISGAVAERIRFRRVHADGLRHVGRRPIRSSAIGPGAACSNGTPTGWLAEARLHRLRRLDGRA